jgi:sigma-B regulation protein RsbU (phosphoserine phosphatase)
VLYDTCDDPLLLVKRLNSVMYRSSDRGSFVTMFIGYLDPVSGHLRYVNAGHPDAVLVGGAEPRALPATGIPVGMLEDFPWQAQETVVEPGETMAVFSDGIPEAQHGTEFFEMQRLRDALTELAAEPDLARVADGLIDRIDKFAAGEHRADDVTLLLLRRN